VIDVKYLLDETLQSAENGDDTGSAVVLAAAAICERLENLEIAIRELTLTEACRDIAAILDRRPK